MVLPNTIQNISRALVPTTATINEITKAMDNSGNLVIFGKIDLKEVI